MIPLLLSVSAALGGVSVVGALAAVAPPSGAWPGEVSSGMGALRIVTVVLFVLVLLGSSSTAVIARRQASRDRTAPWPAGVTRLCRLTVLASALGASCLVADLVSAGPMGATLARLCAGLGFLAGAVLPLLVRQLVLEAGVRADWVPSLTPFSPGRDRWAGG